MRIIAGEFRSRPLVTPADSDVTRPIPDRVKESLFAILRGHTEGATVFDAFSGTGAIGLEALSRGAKRCVMVEKDKRIAGILQKNIDNLGVQDRAELVIGDALGPGALARCPRPVKLVFLDPPYPLVREPLGFKRVMAQLGQLVQRLEPDGYAVLRTPWPFFLEVPEAEAPIEEEHPRKERRAKEKERALRDPGLAERWARRTGKPIGTPPPGDAEEEAEAEAESAEEMEIRESSPRPVAQKLEASLEVPGARGPETHTYGGMAVHLYMKA